MEIKIIKTKVASEQLGSSCSPASSSGPSEVSWAEDGSMLVPCKSGGVLQVLTVQPPTKKAISTKDFKNGLRGKRLLVPAPSAQ